MAGTGSITVPEGKADLTPQQTADLINDLIMRSQELLKIKLRHALLKRLYVLCLLQFPAQITDSVTDSFIKNNPVILCIFIVQKKGKTQNTALKL